MITDKSKTPTEIFIQENMGDMVYGVCQDESIRGIVKYIRYDQVPQVEEYFERPNEKLSERIEVKSRLDEVPEDLMPIAKFVMEYANWNLHKCEWSQPTLEVPLFRILDALINRGNGYCTCN